MAKEEKTTKIIIADKRKGFSGRVSRVAVNVTTKMQKKGWSLDSRNVQFPDLAPKKFTVVLPFFKKK
ncbi:MAG: hypothetical protein AAB438_02915 [Patescibacteria group bacterium]